MEGSRQNITYLEPPPYSNLPLGGRRDGLGPLSGGAIQLSPVGMTMGAPVDQMRNSRGPSTFNPQRFNRTSPVGIQTSGPARKYQALKIEGKNQD